MFVKRQILVLAPILVLCFIYLKYSTVEESSWKKAAREIFIDNAIWQVLESKYGFIYIFNAYLESRFNETFVLVNIQAPKLNITTQKLFCKVWFGEDDLHPVLVEAVQYQIMYFQCEKR